LVVSKVDYCCSVLAGVSDHLLDRLQSILNARLVFSARRSERITILLRDLHWLRVPERIQFRLCVPAFRYLNGSAPPYLAESIRRTADVDSLFYHHDACCPVSAAINLTVPFLSLHRGHETYPCMFHGYVQDGMYVCMYVRMAGGNHLLSATTEHTSV